MVIKLLTTPGEISKPTLILNTLLYQLKFTHWFIYLTG